jgi:hypothetical protein
MFGEITETVVKMRMEAYVEAAEHERLVRSALQNKRSSALDDMQRRTTTLPGLLLRWWNALTQHRPVSNRQLQTGT